MKKYALGFIAILVIALLTPGLGSAATYGTDLWTDLKSYNFTEQSTWDDNGRLKPIESFADGESAFAHYLIGQASGTGGTPVVVITAPFNIAGYKTLTAQQFTSTTGGGSASPTLTFTGAARALVNIWGRLGKDDVYTSVTVNNYLGSSATTTAGGMTAPVQIISASGTTTPVFQGMSLTNTAGTGTNGTYGWNLSGAGAVIMSASSVSSGTTHIMIRVTK